MAIQLPSASNTAGTTLGGLAGTIVLASGSSWPFVIAGATALGMTPAGAAAVLAVVATVAVNYGVTHFAELKNLNGIVGEYWPQIEASYPAGRNGARESELPPVSEGPANGNFNKPS